MTGILLMCTGVACLCINDAIAKTLAVHYAPVQILFLRNLLALPGALVIAVAMGGTAALRSYRPMAHVLRGALWLGAAALFFTSLRHLGLAEATTLIFAAPVFITALSAMWLREEVGWRRWSAVLVGFAGVLVVVRPGSDAFQAASVLPVAAAVLYAVLMIGARWVDPRESVWTLMLYLVGAGALLAGLVSPFFWTPVRGEDAALFIAIAIFGTAGITMMTQAFRFAPAPVVAPFDYTALLWATALGWLVWRDVPDLATYLGAGIIAASGLFIVFRERAAEDRGAGRDS
ncbi:putative membrane protein [Pseudooceanicola batsensis HTCC2597]|uniref:Putative membrane protein n=1 Tax=Pseudooceanicola batsensis (strain ATCC BAA-863 / DSM 15984 / KCTC 12145 / HTCC2597) TaxID=252305 RepID=A3TUF1_PSEBH|nr:DMT family transporter [Pseudooceanicola batsensis]EAQ04147.1 putative membrane protein [Pseudooceanicola batsensis HTCC2597]